MIMNVWIPFHGQKYTKKYTDVYMNTNTNIHRFVKAQA